MRFLVKRALRAATSALALVGFVDVIGRVFLAPFTGELFGLHFILQPGVRIERMATSLSGRYNAVVLSQEGSGLDPHCTTIVSVIATSSTVASSWAPENRVYVGDCARDITPSWPPSAEALLSGSPVRDRLSINADPNEAWSVSRIAEGGSVLISFATSKSPPRLH